MLQFVDSEIAGDCPTSKLLRDRLRQFHHTLKVHCGLSQECVDGDHQQVEDMSSEQLLKKIWHLLWNKDEGGVDFIDSESMYICTYVRICIVSYVLCINALILEGL